MTLKIIIENFTDDLKTARMINEKKRLQKEIKEKQDKLNEIESILLGVKN